MPLKFGPREMPIPACEPAPADWADEINTIQRPGRRFLQCFVESKGHVKAPKTTWPSTASWPISSRLDLSCHWNQMGLDERVRLTTVRNSPSLKSKSSASHDFDPHRTPQSPVAMGKWQKQQVRIHWKLPVTNLHTGGPGHMVALHWTEAAAEFGIPLGV